MINSRSTAVHMASVGEDLDSEPARLIGDEPRPIFRTGDLFVDLVRRIVKLGEREIKL